MYKFNEVTIEEKEGIIFLCGTKYRPSSVADKRNVLKEYLQKEYPHMKILILEENFVFGRKEGYLSYDDIFMKNLSDVEEMTAAFSDGIIIIHDSISTGAELAAFATNELLEDKLCVLEPDSTGVEERKISSFLELAYFVEDSKIERIVYYPEVYSHYISDRHIEKRTNFAGNVITPILGTKIKSFVESHNKGLDIRYEKMKYQKVNSDRNVVSYSLDDKKLSVYVSGQVVLYQILGLLTVEDIRRQLRKLNKLYIHIDYLCENYKNILCNTIQERLDKTVEEIEVIVKENRRSIRDIIAYSLYMLQAFELLSLTKERKMNKIVFKNAYTQNIAKYKGIITECDDSLRELLDE